MSLNPQQPAWISASTVQSAERERAFFRSVYSWMFGGLLLTGLTLSVLLFVYTAASVVQAFAVSAGMFGAVSVYGRVTKRDLTSWGAFFFMGVIGLILAMFVNLFIHSTALDLAISSIAVLVFTGLAAYKTQALKAWAHAGGPQGETLAIYGALSLYITFINLFLHILRLMGRRR